jgi:hypothetical protein
VVSASEYPVAQLQSCHPLANESEKRVKVPEAGVEDPVLEEVVEEEPVVVEVEPEGVEGAFPDK